MCLIIAAVLMLFGINLLIEGDLAMGIGSLIASLFFMTIMVRHFLRVKKEYGKVRKRDCLRCSQVPIIANEKGDK